MQASQSPDSARYVNSLKSLHWWTDLKSQELNMSRNSKRLHTFQSDYLRHLQFITEELYRFASPISPMYGLSPSDIERGASAIKAVLEENYTPALADKTLARDKIVIGPLQSVIQYKNGKKLGNGEIVDLIPSDDDPVSEQLKKRAYVIVDENLKTTVATVKDFVGGIQLKAHPYNLMGMFGSTDATGKKILDSTDQLWLPIKMRRVQKIRVPYYDGTYLG